MSIKLKRQVILVLALLISNGAFAQNTEIDELRVALDELRADYEGRIAALEVRLAAAEQAQSVPVEPITGGRSSDSAFNPAIGVIFQGQAWNFANSPEDYSVQGFPFGGEAGPFPVRVQGMGAVDRHRVPTGGDQEGVEADDVEQATIRGR